MMMKSNKDKTNLPIRQAGQPIRQAGLTDRQKNRPSRQNDNKEENNLSGYPVYPDNEDIYSRFKEEKGINPEDISKRKEYHSGRNDEKELDEALSGSDLDIPGTELDDNQEDIGSEDEENNYYSLGGDDHNDLEENKGD